IPLELMQNGFMQRAVLGLLALAPLCALIGCLVVQFRMAFFADAVSHSAFTGIALGLLIGIDPWFSLLGFGVLTGMLTMRLRRAGDLSMDTTLGVVFSTLVALGLAIISARKGLAKSLPLFLYGDILSMTDLDVLLAFALLLATLGFMAAFFNQLLMIGLHEDLARVRGVPVDRLELLFAALVALVVGFSIRAVGILLVTAFLVIPAATARNLATTIRGHVRWSVGLALLSALGGLALAIHFDIAAGAGMVLCAALLFACSVPLRRR
ncbi:MAG TPA: metal ABC transporter permease, partial [Candidatus Ozemobacteraceae bacterium]|nr:metal ABC transporter permease [Candidatus Ozemobacteraceae bacterium]